MKSLHDAPNPLLPQRTRPSLCHSAAPFHLGGSFETGGLVLGRPWKVLTRLEVARKLGHREPWGRVGFGAAHSVPRDAPGLWDE